MTPSSVKSERAAEAVAQHIEALILEGALRPEAHLLPERDLAERLNVSRTTLRDGLKILEARGLLVAGGRSTRIAALGAAAITDPLIALLARHSEGADDYLEFRGIIEGAAAGLAAERATEVERERLRDCLARMARAHADEDPTEEGEADAELHLMIYHASHNLTLLQIMQALAGVVRADVLQNRARLFAIPAMRDLLYAQHLKIGEAILTGDPTAASAAALEHLAYLRAARRELNAADARLDLSMRRLSGGGLAAANRR